MAPASATRPATQDEIDQWIFDCRSGTEWKVKEQSIERLALVGGPLMPTLIDCMSSRYPAGVKQRFEQEADAARSEGRLRVGVLARADASSYDIPYCAALALGKMGEPAIPSLVKFLKGELKQPYPSAGQYAVESLRRIGRPATASLIDLLRETQDLPGTYKVADLLGQIGGAQSVPVLIALLRDKNRSYASRASAAKALQALKARQAVPDLIEVFQEQSDLTEDAQTFIDAVADALARLTGQASGLQFVPEQERIKSEPVPAHYILRGTPEQRRQVMRNWQDWFGAHRSDYEALSQ